MFMMKKEDKPELSNNDKTFLYTLGRGRNTWSVYFLGKDEEGGNAGLIYRLNISSLPFGLRYVKIYDTVLAFLSPKKEFASDRDYGEIRKKEQLSYEEMAFLGNGSLLKGALDQLELTAYIKGGHAELEMNTDSSESFIIDTVAGDIQKEYENIRNGVASIRMVSEGVIDFGGERHSVNGISWVEKKYAEFPKGRVRKKNADILKLSMVPDGLEKVFLLYSYITKSETKTEISVLGPDGVENYIVDKDNFRITENWESPHTGRIYPSKMELESPELGMSLKISAETTDQEWFSESKRNTEGEYLGAGGFEGVFEGMPVKGRCFIECSSC